MRGGGAWILAILLLPVAAAEEGRADVDATPAAEITGTIAADLRGVTLWLEPGAPVRIDAEAARGRIYGEHALGDAGRSTYTVVLHAWTEDVAASPARLVVTPRESAFVEADLGHLHVAALTVGTLPQLLVSDNVSHRAGRWQAQVPAGTFAFGNPSPLRLPVATIVVPAGTVEGDLAADVGVRIEAGAGPAAVRNASFLVLEVENALVTATAGRLYADAFGADVDGRARFAAATGLVQQEAEWALVRKDLAIEGTFRVDGFPRQAPPPMLHALATESGGEPRFTIAGSFRTIEIDGRVVYMGAALGAAGGLALTALGLWLYSRIARANALDHPLRRKIAERVAAEPGVQQERVERDLGLRWGTFRWHLQVLRQNRVLRVEANGRYRLLYPVTAHADPRAAARARGKALAVLDWLAAHPGASATDAAAALGIAQQLAAYHLKALRRMGLVRREGAHPVRWYADADDAGVRAV